MNTNDEQPKPVATDRPHMWPEVIGYVSQNYISNDTPELVDETHLAGDTVKLLVADMKERHEIGIKRYGVPLTSGNGRNSLVDAYQESLDLAVYLRTELDERKLAPVGLGYAAPVRDRTQEQELTPIEIALLSSFRVAVEVALQLRGIIEIEKTS